MRALLVRPALALTAATVIVAVAACGSSGDSTSAGAGAAPSTTSGSTTASASQVASIAAEVPAAVKSKGTLTVAQDASYAPNEFIDTDGKTVIGLDTDLVAALGTVLGLKVTVVNATFDSIIPGLASSKYDLSLSSFTDTKVREKTVDFVTYFNAGTSFFIKAAGGPAIATLDDLCGHHVAVEKGTTEADDATAQDAKCKAASKPGIDIQVYPDQNGANSALQSGRADVSMADQPVAAYQVQLSKGAFIISGKPYGVAPYGIAIPKGNGMAKPIQDGVAELIKDGVYAQILAKWGQTAGAITSPQVNGATS